MNKNVLVSIIVPIYNVDKYLNKCIDSLINQDYPNLEIILVVDGSPDNSLTICREYEKNDNRIIVIDKENGGVSSARNNGLKIAKGEYIVFVDADDWLEFNFISYMVNLMECNHCEFGLSLNSIKSDSEEVNIEEQVEIMNQVDTTALLLSTRVDVGCWNKIYKKDLLERNNIYFDESQFYGEGLLFITTVAQNASSTVVTNKKIYHYRQDNLMSATKKYNYNKYVNGEKSLDIIKSNLIYKDEKIYKQLNIHYCLFFRNAILDTYLNNKKKEYWKMYKYWKKQLWMYSKVVFKYNDVLLKDKMFIVLLQFFPFVLKLRKK